jgi:hypothetical protein
VQELLHGVDVPQKLKKVTLAPVDIDYNDEEWYYQGEESVRLTVSQEKMLDFLLIKYPKTKTKCIAWANDLKKKLLSKRIMACMSWVCVYIFYRRDSEVQVLNGGKLCARY